MFNQKEDVYESSDVPEGDLNAKFAKAETTNPDQVELVHIDIDAAKKKFTGRVLNCENVDFSDSIAKRRRHAYGSSAYVLEIVGKDYGEAETAEQKFNRLTYEIAELAEQLQREGETVKTDLLTDNSVAQLMDELNATKIAAMSGKPPTLGKDKAPPPKTAKEPKDQKISSLESRVRRIEELVGSTGDVNGAPLIESLEDLKFRTEALNSTFLDGIDSRLNSVLNKLDQVETRKKQTENGELEEKVNTLYDLMSKWDATCTNLPCNVKRLQTLRGLHEQASQFSERLSQMVGIKEQLEKAAAASRMGVAELQSQTKEEISALLKHIVSLEAKLAK